MDKFPAAASPTAFPPPPVMPPLPPISPVGSPAPSVAPIADIHKEAPPSFWRRVLNHGPLPYPGKFDDLSKESKGILDSRENFDGFNFDVSRTITANFDMTHAIHFGSQTEPPSYNFMTRYFSPSGMFLDGKLSPGPMLLNGTVQGRIAFPLKTWYRTGPGGRSKPISKLSLRLTGVVGKPSAKPIPPQFNMELDMKGSDYQAQFKWHNPGMYELSYAQSVLPNVALGLHGLFDSRMGRTELTAAGRVAWNERKCIATASLASYGHLTGSYTQVMEDGRKSWSTDMQLIHLEDHGVWEAVYSAGYAYNLLQSRVRGRVDSNWCCSAILEEKVLDTVTLLICGDMNYAKDVYKVGFGFSFHL
jgi:mitochondrial import receptor subunit TOM40